MRHQDVRLLRDPAEIFSKGLLVIHKRPVLEGRSPGGAVETDSVNHTLIVFEIDRTIRQDRPSTVPTPVPLLETSIVIACHHDPMVKGLIPEPLRENIRFLVPTATTEIPGVNQDITVRKIDVFVFPVSVGNNYDPNR